MATRLTSTSQDELKALYTLKYQKADTVIVGITDCTDFTSATNQEDLVAIHAVKDLERKSNSTGLVLKGVNDGFEITTTNQDELTALHGIANQQKNAVAERIVIPEVTEDEDIVIIETLEKPTVQQIVIAAPVEIAKKETIVTEEIVTVNSPLATTTTVRDIIKQVHDKNPKTKVKWSFKRRR